MENWEKEYIRQCKPLLLREIRCTTLLLAELFSLAILSQCDIETIETPDGNITKVSKLLEILVTKTGAYKALVLALQRTCQSGAALILNPKPQFIEEYPEIFEGTNGSKLRTKVEKKIVASKALGNVLNLDLDFMPSRVRQTLSYYIPRTLISRRRVNTKLFSCDCPDIFIFTGINSTELTKLVKPNRTEKTCNQTVDITVRFMLLEFDEDFEEICKISSASQPVHLIERKSDGYYELVKSHGSIQAIQNYLEGDQAKLSEEAFVETIIQQKSPVCIADTPGMGKSALFVSIAKQVQQLGEKRIVIFASFKYLCNKIPGVLFTENDLFEPYPNLNLILKLSGYKLVFIPKPDRD